MCRIGAIKSSNYVHPSQALKLMESQQKGHDNSGFAMVMHDLGGIFESYKHLPTLSMACTDEGLEAGRGHAARRRLPARHAVGAGDRPPPGLDINAMPNYVFETFDYPRYFSNGEQKEKEELLLDMRLKLRKALEAE